MPVISSVSLLFRSGQGKLTYVTVFRISKEESQFEKMIKTVPQEAPKVRGFLTTLSVFPRMAHRLQQAWVTADATAKPDLGSAGIQALKTTVA